MTNDSYIRDRLAHAFGHSNDARNALAASGGFDSVVETIDSARDFIRAAQRKAFDGSLLEHFVRCVEEALGCLEDAAKELGDVRDTESVRRNLSQAIGALKVVLGSTEGS